MKNQESGKTILLTQRYAEEPFRVIESLAPEGFRLLMPDQVTGERMESLAPEADYLLAGGRFPISAEFLRKAKRLKMIQRTGVGLDTLDLEEIRRRGIPLYVNQGVNAQSVAEHALMLMLACLRRLPVVARRTAEGIWKKQEQGIRTRELQGKTVGLIGMGNTGKALARLLSGFRVTLLYYDVRRLPPEEEEAYGARYAEREEVLRSADIISLHCALTEETRRLISRETLSRMKDGVILINTARGPLVDSRALAEALASGKVAFAGLDVHEEEPIPETYELKGLENVILTPHIAGITRESFQGMMGGALRNIEMFEKGKLEEIEESRYL